MIVDTGVISADIDRSNDWHAASAELLSTAPVPLRVPSLVVTEVCYLLAARLGPAAEADFLMALNRQEFDLIPLTTESVQSAPVPHPQTVVARPSLARHGGHTGALAEAAGCPGQPLSWSA